METGQLIILRYKTQRPLNRVCCVVFSADRNLSEEDNSRSEIDRTPTVDRELSEEDNSRSEIDRTPTVDRELYEENNSRLAVDSSDRDLSEKDNSRSQIDRTLRNDRELSKDNNFRSEKINTQSERKLLTGGNRESMCKLVPSIDAFFDYASH